MSIKRQAPSELNHQNWDAEDPEDEKQMGQFKAASKDVLEKRVIRTAKRKIPVSSEVGKSLFSGFGGFKAQSSSFDFLANLTNGNKSTNGSTGTSGSETSVTPGLFTSKPAASSSGLFGTQTSTTPLSTQPTLTSPFGTSVKTSPSTLFTATKVDSTKESTSNMQPISSSTKIDSVKSTVQATPSVFGVSSTSAKDNKPLFSSSTPFKAQLTSNTNTAMVQTSFGMTTTPAVTSVTPEKKSDDSEKPNDKKIKYFSKLKGLNESVSDWINKHVAQSPLCILSPIFKDYEKYLKEITVEYQSVDKQEMDVEIPAAKTENVQSTKTPSPFALNNTGPSPFSRNVSSTTPFGNSNLGASPSKIDTSTSNQDVKTPTPFGLNNTGSSLTSHSTKMSVPFATNNTVSAPFNSRDTKTPSPFAFNNTGSPPMTSQSTKTSTPFGINNTNSSPLKSQDIKTSSPFGNNNAGASPLKSQDAQTSLGKPFGINNNDLNRFNSSPSGITSKPSGTTSKPSLFGTQNDPASSPENKQPSFSFGIKTSPTNASSISTTTTGFSFVVTPSATSASTSPFSLATNTSTNQTSTAPFSFGTGKPFSFSPSTVKQPSSESAATENEEDEPPKVEYTPVKEDNSIYEKKCKIFVKKDGNFADKGVGTLYIKKIEGNVKHQLLVRANTNLGTVLLNFVLAEAIPTQRMGKNNVMLVCIPTPDAKPPPTPILIRVKTGEEADELLQTLDKYKA